MNEALLQFIWQYSIYDGAALRSAEGEPVTVIHPGQRNTNAGPDFLNARIKIGKTILAGHIELHVHTSDWLKHEHQHDDAYKNLILHVVYNNDLPAINNIPLLELATHIPKHIEAKYSGLINTRRTVPCAGMLGTVKDITRESWMSRLLVERWESKLADWEELQKKQVDDWQNLLYWRMAANFGFKVNATPFRMLAQSLDINILAKHRENLLQIEALLFGQAGMLERDFEDAYPNSLKEEYTYLRKKYKLEPIATHLWKFLRMRPANFPTVRIAQFAALVHRSVHLFSQVIELYTVKELSPLLEVTASEYWDTHFLFDEESPYKLKHLGKSSVQNIIINTIAPVQFLFARKHGGDGQQEKALQLLEALPAEKNHIIDDWQNCGWSAANAAQSQALIQLRNNYCNSRQCLSCVIGLNIIRSAPVE
jgi:hypothetical protein